MEMEMQARVRRTFESKPNRLVAAVFFDEVTARDAIADLKIAHFHADQIAVALPEKRTLAQGTATGENRRPPDLDGKHSIFWRLRHSAEHDLHSHGPGLTTREDLEAAGKEKPAFTEVDLADTLGALGVAEDTIRLLDDRMGPDGLLILVDAGEREDEAESILVGNRGMLRTAMVTEPSGHKLPKNAI
jgi:hypothetical protein